MGYTGVIGTQSGFTFYASRKRSKLRQAGLLYVNERMERTKTPPWSLQALGSSARDYDIFMTLAEFMLTSDRP
jgi:hypothetical protein